MMEIMTPRRGRLTLYRAPSATDRQDWLQHSTPVRTIAGLTNRCSAS